MIHEISQNRFRYQIILILLIKIEEMLWNLFQLIKL